MTDDETDDEGLELIEERDPETGRAMTTVRARKPLIPAEKDLLDLAIIAAADGFFDKAERQAVAARIVEASREKLSYRHDSMIRTVILLATAWRNGQEGAKELVGVRLAVAGHFRARIERRRVKT